MGKKNAQFIISVALLSLLVVGLGGYIIWDKALSTNDPKENESGKNSGEVNNGNQQNVATNSKILSGSYADHATTVVLNDGGVYISFEPCMLSGYNGMHTEFCSSIDDLIKSYKSYEFNDFDYESLSAASTWRLLNSNFFGIKLDVSDIKNVYPVLQGQVASYDTQGLALVKDDGSLVVISFQNIATNNLMPKATGLTNIVIVENKMGDGGIDSVAIDASGQEEKLYEYFQ